LPDDHQSIFDEALIEMYAALQVDPKSFLIAVMTIIGSIGYQIAALDEMPLDDRTSEYFSSELARRIRHGWEAEVSPSADEALSADALDSLERLLRTATSHGRS